MQVFITTLLNWRKWINLVFVGTLFAFAGLAQADTGKSERTPARLVPLLSTPVNAPPVPVPVLVAAPTSAPTCVWVQRHTVNSVPTVVVFIPGMLINVCGCCGSSQAWINGVHAVVPGQMLGGISFEKVCQ